MAPLLFVAANPRECRGWVSRWEECRPLQLNVLWARAGRWRGREVVAIANGAGPERAHAAVAAAPAPSAVCNIGFCGALESSFQIGEIFLPTEIRNESETYPVRQPGSPGARSGALISVPRIAQTALEKKKLRERGALAVEMEAAGVARASQDIRVPFYCVRVVSDLAGEDFANDFNRALTPDGRFSIARLLGGALGSPVRRIAELIRLSRRTALASENLGEFLANCTF